MDQLYMDLIWELISWTFNIWFNWDCHLKGVGFCWWWQQFTLNENCCLLHPMQLQSRWNITDMIQNCCFNRRDKEKEWYNIYSTTVILILNSHLTNRKTLDGRKRHLTKSYRLLGSLYKWEKKNTSYCLILDCTQKWHRHKTHLSSTSSPLNNHYIYKFHCYIEPSSIKARIGES